MNGSATTPWQRDMSDYTRNQIAAAVNTGVDMVVDGDTANLVVNAIMTLLDKPEATIEEVIEECYQEDPEEVLSWVDGES